MLQKNLNKSRTFGLCPALSVIPLILLGACNSNSPSGSQNPLTNPFLVPNSATQETSEQSPSAAVDAHNTLITPAQENAPTTTEQENNSTSSEQNNASSLSELDSASITSELDNVSAISELDSSLSNSEQDSASTDSEQDNSPANSPPDTAPIAVEQPDTNPNTTPSIGSAMAAENDNSTDSQVVDVTVSCTSPGALMQERTLQLVNEARSQPRNCGTESFQATSALQWNTQLLEAADKHSVDMAQHNFFNHSGSDGSNAPTRVGDTGYEWRTVGENIAAGQFSADDAVAAWLNSPGHCKNLMNPDFNEMAVSCAEDNASDFTRYWTNVLATQR